MLKNQICCYQVGMTGSIGPQGVQGQQGLQGLQGVPGVIAPTLVSEFFTIGRQPEPVSKGNPFTFTNRTPTPSINDAEIAFSSSLLGNFTQIGTVFTIPHIGLYHVTFQAIIEESGSMEIYFGDTVLNMKPQLRTLAGRLGILSQIIGRSLIEVITPDSVLSINAASENTNVLTVPTLESEKNMSVISVLFQKL